MEEALSFDFLVLLLKRINRGELEFFESDGLIYVSTKDGHKAILNKNLAYIRHGATDMLPYNLNP